MKRIPLLVLVLTLNLVEQLDHAQVLFAQQTECGQVSLTKCSIARWESFARAMAECK